MAILRIAAISIVLAFAHLAGARASEITLWTQRAIATVLAEVGPQFEQQTGHKVKVTSDLTARFLQRIDAGEHFDIIVSAAPDLMDGLVRRGKIVAESRTPLVRSGIGVEVRAGAPKPDISSVDAFKHALLNAQSIGYLPAGSGTYIAVMLERLGIADAIKAKVTRPDRDIVSEMVARGELEIGMVVITQILTTPGVDFVGPLPPELQHYVEFVAGVSTESNVRPAVTELLKFLKGPVAIPVIRAQGMEPL
ncbi:MAG: molybdate ABC transporter substrate-binding protein [Alphaproteobacteria bacterium]